MLLIGELFEEVGRVAVDFGTHDVSLSIPLSLLGDDGAMNIAGVFGTARAAFEDEDDAEPTDVVPNAGFITTVPVQGDGLQALLAKQGADLTRKGLRCRKAPIGGWVGLRSVADSLE